MKKILKKYIVMILVQMIFTVNMAAANDFSMLSPEITITNDFFSQNFQTVNRSSKRSLKIIKRVSVFHRLEKAQQQLIYQIGELHDLSKQAISLLEIQTIEELFNAGCYKYSWNKKNKNLNLIVVDKSMKRKSTFTKQRVPKEYEEKHYICSVLEAYFKPNITKSQKLVILANLEKEELKYAQKAACGWDWIIDRDEKGNFLIDDLHQGLRGLHIIDRTKLPVGFSSKNLEVDAKTYGGKDNVKELFFWFSERNQEIEIFFINNWPTNKKMHRYNPLARGQIDIIYSALFLIDERVKTALKEIRYKRKLERVNDKLKKTNKELAQSKKKLFRLTIRDGLTGIFNRRYFDEEIKNEVSLANRSKSPLSLLVLDIDHFKAVNDTYGHQAGDAVLIQFARVIEEVIRETDIFCRYGGEEFAVILPSTNIKGALALAQKIREAVENTEFLAKVDNQKILIKKTVSIGVASFPECAFLNNVDLSDNHASKENLIAAADSAVYSAKDTGRNQVVVFDENLINEAASDVTQITDTLNIFMQGVFSDFAKGTIITDKTGKITGISDKITELFKKNKSEIIHKNVLDFLGINARYSQSLNFNTITVEKDGFAYQMGVISTFTDNDDGYIFILLDMKTGAMETLIKLMQVFAKQNIKKQAIQSGSKERMIMRAI